MMSEVLSERRVGGKTEEFAVGNVVGVMLAALWWRLLFRVFLERLGGCAGENAVRYVY